MSATPEAEADRSSPHPYFVDETGDGVIFDGKGRVLVGTGKVQDYFTVGMVECWTLKALSEDLAALRDQLLEDPYFKGVPSMQPEAKKTALFFHAKDDLPEVRREVFRVLERHDFSFYAIVRTMSAVARRVKARNERDPTYRYRPTELYDSAVRRLFDKKLHTRPAFDVIFASRGKARTQALREHLLKAQVKSRKAAGTYPDAAIHVRAMPAQQHAGLQVADYCLWALQRLLTKGEDRFLSLIWPKVGLIVDADDISEKPYGTYHTRKRPPLDAQKIKSRKVED
ncbi:MAG: DUF3800 domain-containing protein [Verrucomicrobia bacterium]|nr:DUF3800 domain-containing protein [Verrucomicrobiota bacterium]